MIKTPKFNLMDLSLAEIERDLEYLLFVDNEEDMKGYTHLEPILKQVAELVVVHADAAVRAYQTQITYDIAASVREHAGEIIFGARIETEEELKAAHLPDEETEGPDAISSW